VITDSLLKRFDLNGPRYTSYPTADRFNPAIGPNEFERALASARGRATSLYVHIPFCRSLCYYCACNKIVSKSSDVADQYLDSLAREIDLVADTVGRLPIAQLAFGGGTPNFFSIQQFERLFRSLARRFDLRSDREQSIEIDPRYLDDRYMAALSRLGFNRVSFGVQDFDEQVQQLIHRFQSFEQTGHAVKEARDAGFASVSFDLVYGLPIQSRDTFAKTLERVLSLEPDRVALFNYAHIPERFKAQRRVPTESLPTIEERIGLFSYACERLVDAGYISIGLDHFAKPSDALAQSVAAGTLRRNFQGYSTHQCAQLIGLGVSAISQFAEVYVQNSAQLDVYRARIDQRKFATQRGLVLSKDDRIRARVIEQIMCHARVDWTSVDNEFGIVANRYFARELLDLRALQDDGVVSLDPEELRVSESGRLLLRAVAMVFDTHRTKTASRGDETHPVRFSRIA
jgi:oxygen-independent coproporphyrinogen III oxidase